jgi:hypothetical protein
MGSSKERIACVTPLSATASGARFSAGVVAR